MSRKSILSYLTITALIVLCLFVPGVFADGLIQGINDSGVPTNLKTDSSGYLKISKHEWNGTAWVTELTPTVFKVFDVAVCATQTTIWDPAAGKKFRLMGFTMGTSAAGTIALKDNTDGTTIFASRTGASIPFSSDLKRGILSATADNVLTITSSVAASCTGTVWGIEE